MMEKINIKKLFSTIFLFIFFTNLFILLLTAKTVSANDDKIIQFYLNQLGLNSGAVDGQPGIKTKAALKRFYALNHDLKAKKLGFDAKNDVLNVAKDENIVGFHYGLCSHSNQNIRGPS